MRSKGVVCRPPSEEGSLIVQATIGCSHTRGAFCGMCSAVRFRARALDEVIAGVDMVRASFGDRVAKVILAGGNTPVLPTERLIGRGL